MKTGTEPVKRQFLNIEHCEDAMLHRCAARFSLLHPTFKLTKLTASAAEPLEDSQAKTYKPSV